LQPPKPESRPTGPPSNLGAFAIRPATRDDAPAILALERRIENAAHWPESSYLEMFVPGASARIALLLEAENHSIVGFVIARVAGDECELENIAVAPNLQRRGAGTQLIRSLITEARKNSAHSIFLEVRESNTAARGLYEERGFEVTGRRLRYYSRPEEDAVLYSVRL
jgi:ribosomal-protein-alanine N-acetyltransferase